ncbi:hypothetical protein TSUD_139060 [Trifolium subterraneum]|uniref:Uncharacterized protein n=1 Tax=Trifolium subterraneum TaxID=3900 RepID=A0A2Z6NMG5_TRISU|nr:hypothetical protein TSUD_139060 [Trifolium subterraneum]
MGATGKEYEELLEEFMHAVKQHYGRKFLYSLKTSQIIVERKLLNNIDNELIIQRFQNLKPRKLEIM